MATSGRGRGGGGEAGGGWRRSKLISLLMVGGIVTISLMLLAARPNHRELLIQTSKKPSASKLSEDPVLRNLQIKARELRQELQTRAEQERDEQLALLHTLEHKKKLLMEDEQIEKEQENKSNSDLHRADGELSRSLEDDLVKLHNLEAMQTFLHSEKARKANIQRLSTEQVKHDELVQQHELLVAKIKALQQHLRGVLVAPKHDSEAEDPVIDPSLQEKLRDLRAGGHKRSSASASSPGLVQHDIKTAEKLISDARHILAGHGDHQLDNEPSVISAKANMRKDLDGMEEALLSLAHSSLRGDDAGNHKVAGKMEKLLKQALLEADILVSSHDKSRAEGQLMQTEMNGVQRLFQQSSLFGAPATKQHPLGVSDGKSASVSSVGLKGTRRDQQVASHDLPRSERKKLASIDHAMTRTRALKLAETALEGSVDYLKRLDPKAPSLADVSSSSYSKWQEESAVSHAKLLAMRQKLKSLLRNVLDTKDLNGRQDKELNADIATLLSVTSAADPNEYDKMLKQAIKQNEGVLTSFKQAESSADRNINKELLTADSVFSDAPEKKRVSDNEVQEAMRAAQEIEQKMHLVFPQHKQAKLPSIPHHRPANYIPGIGVVHKQRSFLSELWKHHRVPISEAERRMGASASRLQVSTGPKLNDDGSLNVRRAHGVHGGVEPSGWSVAQRSAKRAMKDGNEVGTAFEQAMGWALNGIATDRRSRAGAKDGNSLWKYI
eukprot:757468-Hanusia_phi.AAC.3